MFLCFLPTASGTISLPDATREKVVEASVPSSSRNNISVFLFHALGQRLRDEPPTPDVAHTILRHDKPRSTGSAKDINRGPFYSIPMTIPLPLPSTGCRHPSPSLCFCLLYTCTWRSHQGCSAQTTFWCFFPNILRAASYHRIQVLFLSFISLIYLLLSFILIHTRDVCLDLLVANKHDQWILINTPTQPLHHLSGCCWNPLKILSRKDRWCAKTSSKFLMSRPYIWFFSAGQRGKRLLPETICVAVWQKVTLMQFGVVWSACSTREGIDDSNS